RPDRKQRSRPPCPRDSPPARRIQARVTLFPRILNPARTEPCDDAAMLTPPRRQTIRDEHRREPSVNTAYPRIEAIEPRSSSRRGRPSWRFAITERGACHASVTNLFFFALWPNIPILDTKCCCNHLQSVVTCYYTL